MRHGAAGGSTINFGGRRSLRAAGAWFHLALTAAECTFLVVGVFMLHDIAQLVKHSDQVVEKVVLPVQHSAGAMEKGATAVAKALPEIAKNSAEASKQGAEASRQISEAAKQGAAAMVNLNGLITDLRGTAAELHTAVADLDGDATTLTNSANSDLQEAGEALKGFAALEKTLQAQLDAASPEATATLKAMRKLAENPAIADVIENVKDATFHGAETMETVDLATRGLRQKIGRVKWILEHLLGLVKIAIPL